MRIVIIMSMAFLLAFGSIDYSYWPKSLKDLRQQREKAQELIDNANSRLQYGKSASSLIREKTDRAVHDFEDRLQRAYIRNKNEIEKEIWD